MKTHKSFDTKGLISILFILTAAVASSAYTAYLTYTGKFSFDDFKFWDNEVEYDEQYQMFLVEEKRKQDLSLAEAEILNSADDSGFNFQSGFHSAEEEQAYLRLSESAGFKDIRPIIYTYTGIEDLSCISLPGDGYTVCSLSSGYQGTAVGFDGDSIVLEIADSLYAYASKLQFREGACYATIDKAVDLRGYLPHAEYSLEFAAADNLTGRSLYPAIPLMENNTAEALLQAAEQFWYDGYLLVIHDAYRPATAQYELWDKVGDSTFLVNPYKDTSWHNVGKAVDISLKEATTGEEVELPSPVYDFSPASFRNNEGNWTTEAVNNVRYITSVMESAGFTAVESMWWHYEYLDKDIPNLPKNLNYLDISYEPLS